MEKILENTKLKRTGTNNTKSNLIAYADDIDVFGRLERDATGAFSKIAAKMGLVVNEEKTNIILATRSKTPRRKKPK